MEREMVSNILLGIKEVAEFMGVHQRTIYRLVNDGKIPGLKLGGKWFFDREIIKQWINQQMISNCTKINN
jgi:excisionase family DNA binding protein